MCITKLHHGCTLVCLPHCFDLTSGLVGHVAGLAQRCSKELCGGRAHSCQLECTCWSDRASFHQCIAPACKLWFGALVNARQVAHRGVHWVCMISKARHQVDCELELPGRFFVRIPIEWVHRPNQSNDATSLSRVDAPDHQVGENGVERCATKKADTSYDVDAISASHGRQGAAPLCMGFSLCKFRQSVCDVQIVRISYECQQRCTLCRCMQPLVGITEHDRAVHEFNQ